VKHGNVLERVYNPGRLRIAWQQVRKNAGAAGIDKMTVEAFERREDELVKLIHEKLKAGTYRFKPARRVLIPKEGSSKKRKSLYSCMISPSDLLNNLCSVADRRAAYLAGTSRSVGRGWPSKATSYPDC
jgi:hypothetical protein